MHIVRYILAIFFIASSFFVPLFAAPTVNNTNINDKDLYVRDIEIGSKGATNPLLESFMDTGIRDFFFSAGTSGGGQGFMNVFVNIAFGIKNFFIGIAVLFLIIGVLKLLFSSGDDEAVKKWRSNIIWVSVGIIIMQIAFSAWNLLIIKDVSGHVGSMFAWQIYKSLFVPLVNLLQILASLAFLGMAIYAFFIMVSGGGDEEKMKKGKTTIIYGLIGYALIKLPKVFISAIYGSPDCKESLGFVLIGDCVIKNQDLSGTIGVFARVVNFLNGFLALICVFLIIYAGWLVFISGGDEEKLKKAKNIVLYIIIGLVLLVGSHALFRFFLMK